MELAYEPREPDGITLEGHVRLEVTPGAECSSGPGDQDGPDLGVVDQIGHRCVELLEDATVDGVQLVGPVEAHDPGHGGTPGQGEPLGQHERNGGHWAPLFAVCLHDGPDDLMLGDLPRCRGGKAFDYLQAFGKLVGGKALFLEAGNRGDQVEARTAVEDDART